MTQQVLLDRPGDANFDPVPGAKANVFESGTTNPVTVFQDTDLTVPHPNPIVADAEGRFPQAFYGGALALKVDFDTAADVTLYTLDPVPLTSISAGQAANITSAPFPGVTDTNVQAALQSIYSAAVGSVVNAQTPVLTAGSGNAYTLAPAQNIDAYAAGQEFQLRLNHQNTGNVTLNVQSLGAVSAQWYNENTLEQIPPGAWQLGANATVYYDGTRFVWRNPGTAAEHGSASSWLIDYPTRTLRCWGAYSAGAHAPTISFPKTFANVPEVFAIANINSARSMTVDSVNTTSFRGYQWNDSGGTSSIAFRWHAIGEWDGSS